MNLSIRDRDRLIGVHPALVLIVEDAYRRFPAAFAEAPSMRPFVIEGLRTIERQREYVRTGASTTMDSRHLTGHAVDVGIQAGGAARWEFDLYRKFWLDCVKPSADSRGIQITWGGVWPRLRDGPHFELDRTIYSA